MEPTTMTTYDNSGNGQRAGQLARYSQGCLALLAHPTVDQAAAAVGVNSRTLCRWLTDPDFRAMLAALQSEVLGQAARRLARLATIAIDTLEALLNDEDVTPGVRAKAADLILNNAIKYSEAATLDDRITQLEQRVFIRGGTDDKDIK